MCFWALRGEDWLNGNGGGVIWILEEKMKGSWEMKDGSLSKPPCPKQDELGFCLWGKRGGEGMVFGRERGRGWRGVWRDKDRR